MNPRHYGRYGDDQLVHVSSAELRGLAALSPTGRLTTNPKTGYPEAFSLGTGLGILGSIAGIVAAPFTGGMSLALTGAIGGGLGTMLGDTLSGKSFGDSLGHGLLSGLMGYGLGSAASGLMEPAAEAAAGAVPAAQSAMTPLAASGDGISDLLASGATSASPAASGMGATMAQSAPYSISGLNQSLPGSMAGFNVDSAANGGAGSLSPQSWGQGVAASAGAQGRAIGQGLADPSRVFDTFGSKAFSTTVPIAAGLYGQGLNSNTGATAPPQQYPTYPTLKPNLNQGPYTLPPANYDYSTGKAWNYYPQAYAEGGSVDEEDDPQYGSDAFEQADLARIQRRQTRDYGRYATMKQLSNNDFEMAKQYAAMRNQRTEDEMRPDMSPQEALQEQAMAQQMQQRYADFNRSYQPPPGGVPGYAGGGGVSGPGDGLSDAIPAIINSRKPAALSSGEYVVPAHAVSALGNGSTEAGTGQLDNMVNNVMQQKYGSPNRRPNPINPRQALGGLGSARRPFGGRGMPGVG